MKKILFFLTFLFTLNFASAQETTCIEDFENEQPTGLMNQVGNWLGVNGDVAFEIDGAGNNTSVLRGADGSGGSWMSNVTDYGGDWLNESCELCFDIRYVAGPNNPPTGVNAINIYQNPASNPTNTNPGAAGVITSRFQVFIPIGSDWVQVCVPIALSSGGVLPSNSEGQWIGPALTTDWDNLIQNVSGIAFRLDFGGGSNPAEDVYADNLCFESCEDPCAIVLDEELDCDADGYNYTFNIENNTGYTVDGIIVNNQYDPSVSIPPNGIYGPTNITIPLGADATYCFDVVMFSENLQCCHYEHCIDLPICNPCDSIELVPTSLDNNEGECCYAIDVVNNFDDQYFTKITSTILTTGVNFSNPFGNNGWTVTPTTGNTLTWTPALPFIDDITDASALNFCLTDILQTNQTPQSIKFDWIVADMMGQDSVACSDTLVFECETCLSVVEEEVICLPTGDYQYCMTIENNDAFNEANEVYFDVYTPAGLQFTPPNVSVNIPPMGSASVCIGIPGPLPAGTEVDYKILLKNFLGDTLNWCCIVDTFTVVIPECGPDPICPEVVDLEMVCIGDTTGDGLPDYELYVTAIGDGLLQFNSPCGPINPPSILVSGSTTATLLVENLVPCPFYTFAVLSSLNDGTICDEFSYELDLPACPPESGLCLCEDLAADMAEGFMEVFDCDGIVTPNALTPCDNVTWLLDGSFLGSSTGNETFTFEYPSIGSYVICMSVLRIDDNGEICQSLTCVDVQIDELCPEPPATSNDVELYPNPATDYLMIDFEKGFIPEQAVLQITDISGNVVYQQSSVPERTIELDISTLPAGMYYLTIEDGKEYKVVERFVKTKRK